MSKSIIGYAVERWDQREIRRKAKRKEEIEWKNEMLEQLEEWEEAEDE